MTRKHSPMLRPRRNQKPKPPRPQARQVATRDVNDREPPAGKAIQETKEKGKQGDKGGTGDKGKKGDKVGKTRSRFPWPGSRGGKADGSGGKRRRLRRQGLASEHRTTETRILLRLHSQPVPEARMPIYLATASTVTAPRLNMSLTNAAVSSPP